MHSAMTALQWLLAWWLLRDTTRDGRLHKADVRGLWDGTALYHNTTTATDAPGTAWRRGATPSRSTAWARRTVTPNARL